MKNEFTFLLIKNNMIGGGLVKVELFYSRSYMRDFLMTLCYGLVYGVRCIKHDDDR